MQNITMDYLFPNKIFHAWTHENTQYCITTEGVILASTNKFKHTSYRVGKLPLDFTKVTVSTNTKLDLDTTNTGIANTLIAIRVVENVILVQFYLLSGELVTYISKSYGVSWTTIDNVPGRQSQDDIGADNIWLDDVVAFIIKDSTGDDCYIFKPAFRLKDIDQNPEAYDWFIIKDDGTIINDPINKTITDRVLINNSFRDSGQISFEMTTDTNNMDGHSEYVRKPYSMSWCTIWDDDAPPITIDHVGYLVNPIDPVYYNHNGKTYAIAKIKHNIAFRTGTLGTEDNYYLPDHFSVKIPVLMCFDVDHIAPARPNTPLQINMLDIYGVDQRVAPLHSAYYTTRSGVYSFIRSLAVASEADFLAMYAKAGTIYEYNIGGLVDYMDSYDFHELCTGDLLKITDPKTNQDVVSFIGKGRVYVCTNDPTTELSWEDKTHTDSFKIPTQNTTTNSRQSIKDGVTPTYRSVPVQVWCNYQSILRYNLDRNRLLGYPVSINNDTADVESIDGYKFPMFVPTAGSYNIMDSLNPYTKTILVDTDSPQRLDNALQTRVDKDLYFGGFVADETGYLGSLAGFIEGVDDVSVIPPVIVDPIDPITGTPGPVPGVLAILDGVNKSPSATITNNRLSVTFGSEYGGCLGNISVVSGMWYLELSNINSRSLYFGLVKSTVDIKKEPGDDPAMCLFGLNGEVIVNTRIVHVVEQLKQIDLDGLVIGCLIDMDTRVMTIKTDVSLATMVELPNESLYFYLGALRSSVSENSITVNFGQNPFVYDVPDGYMSGYGLK